MKELLELKSQISESDVVYTFLHCLIRDEQDLIKLSDGNLKYRCVRRILVVVYNYIRQTVTYFFGKGKVGNHLQCQAPVFEGYGSPRQGLGK